MSRPDGRGDHAEQQPTERLATVWGPLSMRTTSVVGAHAPVSSFVVQPALAAELEAALCAEVLRDALPGPDETLETLLQRLRRSDVFDNPRVVYARRTRHGFFIHAPERSDATPRRPGKAGHFRRALRTAIRQRKWRSRGSDAWLHSPVPAPRRSSHVPTHAGQPPFDPGCTLLQGTGASDPHALKVA